MKRSFLKYTLLSFLAVSVLSCDKDDKATEAPTMDEFVSGDSRLTMFNKALTKANLESFKTGPGPFTWFAPTNEAFAAASITEDSLNRMSQGQINYILLYHLANAELNGENMIAVNSSPRTSQLGTGAGSFYIGSHNGENYINGAKIISRDNRVKNGYVHIINKLQVPPVIRGNLQAVLTSTGQHSLFIAALTRANLWASFSTASVFTIFAPTDAAMTAAGYTTANIATANVTTLARDMRYHYILNVRLFTNDLNRTTLPSTAAGSTQYITPSENGTKIKGKGNATPANIVNSDILGINGVVHVIDAVLKP